MRRENISKGIKGIRNKRNYDLTSIVNDMNVYYSNNDFTNKVLLERLHQLRVDKLYMDSFQGGIVGLLIGALAMDSDTATSIRVLTKEAFSTSKFGGFVMIVAFLIMLLTLAGVLLGTIYFIKFTYYKLVKSDVVGNFLDEKEVEIIKQILNNRIVS
ncbi:hypothetical protein [Carnobacterium sp.]|uniref:hypothetical protein n=1 Tax=Carnobacterium sp. TaxID=48221 RepID=UPI00388FA056